MQIIKSTSTVEQKIILKKFICTSIGIDEKKITLFNAE
jgi:hypothetical protein